MKRSMGRMIQPRRRPGYTMSITDRKLTIEEIVLKAAQAKEDSRGG
jgi:hypothetical protein